MHTRLGGQIADRLRSALAAGWCCWWAGDIAHITANIAGQVVVMPGIGELLPLVTMGMWQSWFEEAGMGDLGYYGMC